MPHHTWTETDIRALGVTTDLATAGAILGMGRTKSHELARAGQFPVTVLRHGRRYVVPVAGLLYALGLAERGTDRTRLEDWLSDGDEASMDVDAHQRTSTRE